MLTQFGSALAVVFVLALVVQLASMVYLASRAKNSRGAWVLSALVFGPLSVAVYEIRRCFSEAG